MSGSVAMALQVGGNGCAVKFNPYRRQTERSALKGGTNAPHTRAHSLV